MQIAWRLGVVHVRTGDLAAGRAELERAFAAARAGGFLVAAEVEVSLAELALAENRPDVAEARALSAITTLRAHGSKASLGFGYAALADARRARGDLDGARAALAEAQAIRASLENPREVAAIDRAAERLH